MPNKPRFMSNQKYFGAFRPNKGSVEGKNMVYLGYVQECSVEKCPLFEACTYQKKGKCSYEYEFMKTMFLAWVDPDIGIGDIMSQQQVNRVGTTLVSLYSQFIRLQKIYDANPRLEYEDSKGVIRIHPVLKELRDVQKAISSEIKDLGLLKTWEIKFGKDGKTPGSPLDIANRMKKGHSTRFEEYEAQLRKQKNEGSQT